MIVKITIGIMFRSMSIVHDGLNNLADSASSLITIVGAQLSGKLPDSKHPYGYGRIESLSVLVIVILTFALGVVTMIDAVTDLMHPTMSQHTPLSITVVVIALFFKMFLSWFAEHRGKMLDSEALTVSGVEARTDCLLSASTIVAALVAYIWKINIEEIIAVVISLMLLKTCIELLRSAVDDLLGNRIELDKFLEIRNAVRSLDHVQDAYNLMVHRYGKVRNFATINITVDPAMTAEEISILTSRIVHMCQENFGISIGSVGVYCGRTWVNATFDPSELPYNETSKIPDEADIVRILFRFEDVLSARKIMIDPEKLNIDAEIVISDLARNRLQLRNDLKHELETAYPSWHISLISQFR